MVQIEYDRKVEAALKEALRLAKENAKKGSSLMYYCTEEPFDWGGLLEAFSTTKATLWEEREKSGKLPVPLK